MILRKANKDDIQGIYNLFKKNYPLGYYSPHFTSIENIKKLMESNNFIGVVGEIKRKIIAFSGLYFDRKDKQNLKIYLSNYLVDEDYRNRGIGSKIELEKNRLFTNFNEKLLIYSYVIPRTKASLSTKIKYGYEIWGIKMFYGELEPSPVGWGHLFVLGKLQNYKHFQIEFPIVHNITKKLIDSLPYNPVFENKFENNNTGIDILYPESINYGQYTVTIIRNEKKEFDLKDIILVISNLQMGVKENPYTSIRIATDLPYFSEIDKILIQNSFYPTSILPYFCNGSHIIEYQYLEKRRIKELSKDIANYNEIVDALSIS